MSDAKFIRNGQNHTLDETIAHVRQKWKWKKSEIRTAEDIHQDRGVEFSSTSGKPYIIRLPDGTEMKTEEWF